jgi:hypothetical protein
MSSLLTSINSNLTFALRLSWNTTLLTEPSSIFYSLEHLKQSQNVYFSTCVLLTLFQHCLVNVMLSSTKQSTMSLIVPITRLKLLQEIYLSLILFTYFSDS